MADHLDSSVFLALGVCFFAAVQLMALAWYWEHREGLPALNVFSDHLASQSRHNVRDVFVGRRTAAVRIDQTSTENIYLNSPLPSLRRSAFAVLGGVVIVTVLSPCVLFLASYPFFKSWLLILYWITLGCSLFYLLRFAYFYHDYCHRTIQTREGPVVRRNLILGQVRASFEERRQELLHLRTPEQKAQSRRTILDSLNQADNQGLREPHISYFLDTMVRSFQFTEREINEVVQDCIEDKRFKSPFSLLRKEAETRMQGLLHQVQALMWRQAIPWQPDVQEENKEEDPHQLQEFKESADGQMLYVRSPAECKKMLQRVLQKRPLEEGVIECIQLFETILRADLVKFGLPEIAEQWGIGVVLKKEVLQKQKEQYVLYLPPTVFDSQELLFWTLCYHNKRCHGWGKGRAFVWASARVKQIFSDFNILPMFEQLQRILCPPAAQSQDLETLWNLLTQVVGLDQKYKWLDEEQLQKEDVLPSRLNLVPDDFTRRYQSLLTDQNFSVFPFQKRLGSQRCAFVMQLAQECLQLSQAA